MTTLLHFVFSGLVVGGIYALVGLGFTLTYDAMRIINVTQAEFVMLGGMLTAVLFGAGFPLWGAAVIAILITIVVGLLMYRLTIAPAKEDDHVGLIIITFGVAIFIEGLTKVLFGKQMLQFPPFSGRESIPILGINVQPQAIWMLVGALLVFLVLHVFQTRFLSGQAMRATSANPLAANLVGIKTSRIIAMAFGISAAIGAIAGVLMTPITLVRYDIGILLGIKGFAAAMLGGLGNPLGALVGGLLVGLLESLGAGYISSAYKDAFAFIVLIGALTFLPHGLLGKKYVERV